MNFVSALEAKLTEKANPKVDLYFHKDFDGVASALAMRLFVERHTSRIVLKEAQYGEILNQTTPTGDVNLLVDFADGFDGLHFHTDHHQGTTVASGLEALFPGEKSNAGVLFRLLPINAEESLVAGIADAADIIDTAGYAHAGFTAQQQRRYVVDDQIRLDPDVAPKLAHYFALNKVLLAFKNRRIGGKKFMERFIADVDSLHPLAMLHVACEHALSLTSRGKPVFNTNDSQEMLRQLQANGDAYAQNFKASKTPQTFIGKDGQILYVHQGNKPVAPMFKPGSYDRYVPFEAHPDTRYLITFWERIGLVQIALNPAAEVGDENLGELCADAIENVSGRFPGQTDMRYFKRLVRNYQSTTDLIPPKRNLLSRLLGDRAEELAGVQLKDQDWDDLEQYEFDCWTLVRENSGGHKAISNIAGLDSFRDQRLEIGDELVNYLVSELR